MTAITQSLSANMEDYLEAIFLLVRDKTVARSKDISQRLKVNRSSVAGAIQALQARGLVNHESYGAVTLTKDGTRIARDVFRRHLALRDFMVEVLSIDPAEAEEAACRMEHGVSKKIVDRFVEFAEFVKTCPKAGTKWVRGFGYQCEDAMHSPGKCKKCIGESLKDIDSTDKKEGGTAAMSMTLEKLKRGEKGQIEKVAGSSAVKRRIRDMGVTSGCLVEVVRVAPMGDPIDLKVKGYHLSLRKKEAADITVNKVVRPEGE